MCTLIITIHPQCGVFIKVLNNFTFCICICHSVLENTKFSFFPNIYPNCLKNPTNHYFNCLKILHHLILFMRDINVVKQKKSH